MCNTCPNCGFEKNDTYTKDSMFHYDCGSILFDVKSQDSDLMISNYCKQVRNLIETEKQKEKVIYESKLKLYILESESRYRQIVSSLVSDLTRSTWHLEARCADLTRDNANLLTFLKNFATLTNTARASLTQKQIANGEK